MTATHDTEAGLAAGHLRALIERIERLEDEKKDVAAAISGVYAEAKANGYDVKTMRRVVRLRAMDADAREHEAAMLDLYRRALGMLADTPLGVAALSASRRTPGQMARVAALAGVSQAAAAQ